MNNLSLLMTAGMALAFVLVATWLGYRHEHQDDDDS